MFRNVGLTVNSFRVVGFRFRSKLRFPEIWAVGYERGLRSLEDFD